jgi:hypothetical protein
MVKESATRRSRRDDVFINQANQSFARYSGAEGHSVPSSAGVLMGALETTVEWEVPGEVLIVTLGAKTPQNCPQVSLLGKLAAA